MKKILVTALAVLIVPFAAWGASKLGASINEGTYEGSIKSVNPDINDTKATMDLSKKDDNYVANVSFANGTKEEWIWNDSTLTQKEFDASNKLIKQYTAKASSDAKYPEAATFNINCKDKARNKCDANVDYRQTWTLQAQDDRISYVVYGVSQDNRSDKNAQAIKRHELSFQRVNSK